MKESAVILFSGGSDSSWLVFQLAKEYKVLHLVTLERRTFYKTQEYSSERAQIFKKYFGSERIRHVLIKADQQHQEICFEDYLKNLKTFGTAVAALSFSKIALHWAAAEYALKNSVKHVFDGGTSYMSMYPDQNRNIAFAAYQKLYASLGIEYGQPLYDDNLDVEEKLFLVGINPSIKIRGTADDKQVYYLEQSLFAHFLNFYLRWNSWQKYEETMNRLYDRKVDYVIGKLSSRTSHPPHS